MHNVTLSCGRITALDDNGLLVELVRVYSTDGKETRQTPEAEQAVPDRQTAVVYSLVR